MQQDMEISEAPPHSQAHRFLCLLPFTSENHDTKKMAIVSPETWFSFVIVNNACFAAPPGASCTVIIEHDKWNTGAQGTMFIHVTFHDGFSCVHACDLP